MKDSYTYHLTYKINGRQGHYYVERYDNSSYGYIDLTYTTPSNSLEVECQNVKVLWIYSRSMYEDESEKVYGLDPSTDSNYYKKYFVDRDLFRVHVYSKQRLTNLTFIDVPLPYNVTVNGEEWWISGINYTYNGKDIVFTNVPSDHTYVDIYFHKPSSLAPTARYYISHTIAVVNETIKFDATNSTDPDGYITTYVWDFGNGEFSAEMLTTYSYSRTGNYSVILTVRDNDYLIDRAYIKISVIESIDAYPKILLRVPDQERPEDSPPWTLKLTNFEYDGKDSGADLNWYLTGVNTSIYSVSGGWSEDDMLVFHPVPNAYGNDEVTIWLVDADGFTDSQKLWVNITPVNDPPIFYGAPDLVVHYDEPYSFNFWPYIYDIDTAPQDLKLSLDDTSNGNYATIDDFKVTFNYPKQFLNQEIFVTLSILDNDITVQDTIAVNVTSDYVPILVKELPDITIYEGTIVTNIFDLDDYFNDPDDDAIFYSFGYTHLTIKIHENHSVDVASLSDWTGIETVTFRATDPIGALSEDTILVTVLFMNDPPVITKVPNLFVRYDYEYRFDLTPYISDPDNLSSELSIWTTDPEHITSSYGNNFMLLLYYPEEMLGEIIKVRITVFDGIDIGYQDIFVTVTSDWPPELHKKLPDIVFVEDEPLYNAFDLENYFFDKDGDALYYTTGNVDIIVTINLDKSVDFAAPENWYGYEIITFRASDPTGALVEDIVTVTVLPVNDRPEVAEIPNQYGQVGEMWKLDLTPYITDVDNDISELDISVDNDKVIVSGSKLVFYGNENLNGKMILVVNDGDLSATQEFEIYVTPPPQEKVKDTAINPSIFIALMILIVIVIILTEFMRKRKRPPDEEMSPGSDVNKPELTTPQSHKAKATKFQIVSPKPKVIEKKYFKAITYDQNISKEGVESWYLYYEM
jgi:hypothetical protein